MKDIRALSIAGPFAFAIASGWKTIELRSWRTAYRGLVLLHSSTGAGYEWVFDHLGLSRSQCPKSALIGAATLADVVEYTTAALWERDLERHRWVGPENYASIRWEYYGGKPPLGHVFKNPILFPEPIPNVKGAFNYWQTKTPEQKLAFELAEEQMIKV